MKTLENREDIAVLVQDFYSKIRLDSDLGPIFNAHISEADWPAHLDLLVRFWETNLLGVPTFKGNPTQKHIAVDQKSSAPIEMRHFGRWLQLWMETIDAHFTGPLADRAKNAARNMSTGQYVAIWQHRQKRDEASETGL